MPPPSPLLDRFWSWYERHYTLNVAVAASLFVLQLLHLYWLTTDVIMFRLFAVRFFEPTILWRYVLVAVDYTEIPALIATSLVYLYELRQRFAWKGIAFLFFLNSQWLHLFWITDEFIVQQLLHGSGVMVFPLWLAWVAILIDYLELPVIVDTLWKVFTSANQEKVREVVSRAMRFYTWRL